MFKFLRSVIPSPASGQQKQRRHGSIRGNRHGGSDCLIQADSQRSARLLIGDARLQSPHDLDPPCVGIGQ